MRFFAKDSTYYNKLMAEKPVIGYWGIQGRAAGARVLLRHLGVDFENKCYEMGAEGPGSWKEDKESLGINFPNIPYYKDGDVFHSETVSILRSICRKYKPEYLGRNLVEQSKADALGAAIGDAFFKWAGANVFPADYKDKKEAGRAEAEGLLATVATCIGDGPFLAGELTYADFGLMLPLMTVKMYDETLISGNETIAGYLTRFMAVEGMEAALAEENKLLLLPPFAGLQADNMPA